MTLPLRAEFGAAPSSIVLRGSEAFIAAAALEHPHRHPARERSRARPNRTRRRLPAGPGP